MFLAPPGVVLAELQDYGYGFTHFAMLAHATGGGGGGAAPWTTPSMTHPHSLTYSIDLTNKNKK